MAHVKHNLKISQPLIRRDPKLTMRYRIQISLSHVRCPGFFGLFYLTKLQEHKQLSCFLRALAPPLSQFRQILRVVLKLLSCNWAQDAQKNQRQLCTDLRFYSGYSILLCFFPSPARQTPQNWPSVMGSHHLHGLKVSICEFSVPCQHEFHIRRR